MNKVLILGLGEVGRAIKRIEDETGNDALVIELNKQLPPTDFDYECMHVCIPYTEKFVEVVSDYIIEYGPKLVIIHSTIPANTTIEINKIVNFSKQEIPIVHSYVRGVHPNLYEGIRTFVKYVGGEKAAAMKGVRYLRSLDIDAKYFGEAINTEMAKIMDTTYYGWNILFCKYYKQIADKTGADFDLIYNEANFTYNDGYTKLGMENVVRPILYPPRGAIGGHCVVENWELLPESKIKNICKLLNESDEL